MFFYWTFLRKYFLALLVPSNRNLIANLIIWNLLLEPSLKRLIDSFEISNLDGNSTIPN